MDNYGLLKECIEKMERSYRFDTITFLDCVLEDDWSDPQFSANTVFDRLNNIILFEKIFYHQTIDIDVFEWMQTNGYSQKDVEIFKQKLSDESERYNRFFEQT